MIGYSQATAYDPVVTNKIFTMSCVIPLVGLIAVALALVFIYPLNKKRVNANCEALAKKREQN